MDRDSLAGSGVQVVEDDEEEEWDEVKSSNTCPIHLSSCTLTIGRRRRRGCRIERAPRGSIGGRCSL